MSVNEAMRLKELEDENRRLKKLVADQALDIQMLSRRSIQRNGNARSEAQSDQAFTGKLREKPEKALCVDRTKVRAGITSLNLIGMSPSENGCENWQTSASAGVTGDCITSCFEKVHD